MFQRVMKMSLWAMSAVVLLGTDARAQSFNGWGWFCCSEVTGEIDLIKVPDPEAQPSIVVVKGRLKAIEVVCKSPEGRTVPTDAGTRKVEAAHAIDEDEIMHGKYGKSRRAEVEISLGEEALRDAEKDAECDKPYWHVVPGSAAPKAMRLTMQSFRCVPESKHDPEPCFQGDPDKRGKTYTSRDTDEGDDEHGSRDTDELSVERTPRDTVQLSCTLDYIRRDKDLRPLHNQEFTCVEQW